MAGLLTGCGTANSPESSGPGASSAPTSSTSSASSAPFLGHLQAGVDPGHIVPAPSTATTTPVENPARPLPIDPVEAVGQEVIITRKAFVPAQLDGLTGKPVVWTNESGTPQVVMVLGFGVRSAPIPPGERVRLETPRSGDDQHPYRVRPGRLARRGPGGFG